MADEQQTWWQRWKGPIYTGLLVLSWLTTVVIALRKGEAPPPPPVFTPAPEYGQGWYADPVAVAEVAAALDTARFQDTPAFLAAGPDPDHVYLWEAAKKALNRHIPTRDQGQVGSCVAFGAACAVEYLHAVQMANGHPATWRDVCQEVIYGGSRVEVGGGRIRGDGSVGAWAADFVNRWGVVARGTYGRIDLTSYSESRCREYGRTGCPDELEPVARERPVRGITQVKTVAELRKAIRNGYPVTIASTVGFTTTRDADGFLQPSGTWAHQMTCVAYRTDRPGFFIMNSWGPNWVKGPAGPGDPPPGGFWVEERTVQKMLNAGDSWAFSEAVAFAPKKLDWLILAPVPFRHPLALGGGRPWEVSHAW